MKLTVFLSAAMTILAFSPAFADEPEGKELSATQIVEKSRLAFYYQAEDMKADVRMELIDRDNGKRVRVLTMLRLNQPEGGKQKYYMYFHEPPDVRRMAFLVWKYPEKEDDRWIYVPAVDLVRRIAASDARSSFVGADFSYEDVSGRDADADTHKLVREDKIGDRNCYVVESVPKEPIEYVKRVSWIDKDTFLPLKEEYYDQQGELFRVFTADKIELIPERKKDAARENGKERKTFPTVVKRTMKNIKTGHRTEVTFTSVSYDVGLTDDIFTERYLRRTPRKWIE